MALGTNEVSLLDLTGAFASIRAGRAKLKPWGITAFASDAGGLCSLGRPAAPEKELPHKEQLTRLLRDVVEHGTGRAAAVDGASAAGQCPAAAGRGGLQKSLREGFGLTVSEAMWKGRAVIGGHV